MGRRRNMGRYPNDWDSRKRSVKRRDNYKCGNCSRQGGTAGDANLHVHHIVPIKDGGSHDISNLQTLCQQCHNAIHHDNKNAATASGTSGSSTSGKLFPTIEDLVYGPILIGTILGILVLSHELGDWVILLVGFLCGLPFLWEAIANGL